jgi:hypothetical protein
MSTLLTGPSFGQLAILIFVVAIPWAWQVLSNNWAAARESRERARATAWAHHAIECTLDVARAEIEQNAVVLRRRRLQLVEVDHYGTESFTKWDAEKLDYLNSRIVPALRSHDLDTWVESAWPRIDAMIEETSQRPAPSHAIERTLEMARREIEQNAEALRVQRSRLVRKDDYGTEDLTKWETEKSRYLTARILPALRLHNLDVWAESAWPKIDAMIEETSQRQPTSGSAAGATEIFDEGMLPTDYEIYCARQLERGGWVTRLTPITGDQGADIIARRDGKILVVQCKLYSQPIGNEAVQQVYAARTFQAAGFAAVVSNQPFTRSAEQLADVTGVRLLHHNQLSSFSG